MKHYRYLLFDLDGTLIWSHIGIFRCFRYALAALGKESPTDEQLRPVVGPPLTESFSRLFSLSPEETAFAVEKYRELYSKVGVLENEPVTGVTDALKALRAAGYTLAVATSKPKIFAEQIVERLCMKEFFAVVSGSGTDGTLPTKADVIQEAMRLLNARADECLMVGDQIQDAAGAKLCGVDFAGLDVGYAAPGELEKQNPKYLFKEYKELVKELVK